MASSSIALTSLSQSGRSSDVANNAPEDASKHVLERLTSLRNAKSRFGEAEAGSMLLCLIAGQ